MSDCKCRCYNLLLENGGLGSVNVLKGKQYIHIQNIYLHLFIIRPSVQHETKRVVCWFSAAPLINKVHLAGTEIVGSHRDLSANCFLFLISGGDSYLDPLVKLVGNAA